MPGIVKTVSVTTAPPSSAPIEMPITVSAGISALRSAWRTITRSIGIWLFYVQHQFEDTYWDHQEEWSFHAGAMQGSTYFDLPGPLRWFTANIGVHHVHHLASRIPCYRLGEVLRDHPKLREVSRLTLRDSFKCFRFALWDENQRRLISFRELRTAAPA